jgi:hypothetical protein
MLAILGLFFKSPAAYNVGHGGLSSKLLYALLYKYTNSSFTDLMTHMTHK